MAYWNINDINNKEIKIKIPLSFSFESFKPDVKGDYIIEELRKEFNRLMSIMVKENIFKTGNVVSNKQCESSLKRVESLVRERFGISITLVGNTKQDYLFSSLFIPPSTPDTELIKNKDDLKDKIADIEKDISKMEQALNVKDVSIDYDKIVIKGLPIDYKVVVMANFELIKKLDLTDADMVTCFIYEIGKIFYNLDNFYKPIKESKVFYKKLKDNFDKNLPANIAFSKAYEETTGDKLDLKDSSAISSFFITTKTLMTRIKNMYNTKSDFVGAFGLELTGNASKAMDKEFINNVLLVCLISFIIEELLIYLFISSYNVAVIPLILIAELFFIVSAVILIINGIWIIIDYIFDNDDYYGITDKNVLSSYKDLHKKIENTCSYFKTLVTGNPITKKITEILSKPIVNSVELDKEIDKLKTDK